MEIKWTKSIIGEIGYIDWDKSKSYNENIKNIPENAREMKPSEALKIIDNDFKAFNKFPKNKYYACRSSDKRYRACRLGGFDSSSWFDAGGRFVDFAGDWLRGILVVKR